MFCEQRLTLQKGVSLLELLLVLSIAAVIIVSSMRYYHQYQRTESVNIFQNNIAQLMQALNTYYHMHCNNTDITNTSISDLQNAGLIGTNLVNPWGGTFAVQVQSTTENTNNPLYVLRVMATVGTTVTPYTLAVAQFLRSALNADPGDSTIVTWTRLPSHAMDDLSSHQWVMQQGPGQAILPGRNVTAVNAGMQSSLWVLNGSLQQFSQAMQAKGSGYANFNSFCPN